jgi:hypothetical protein
MRTNEEQGAGSVKRPNSYRAMARDAEQYFPVRIRVARDQLGRERQYDEMRRWLDQQTGPGRHWHIAERLPTLPETLLFYFVAVADAQAFVDRFSCGIWIAGEWPHGGAPVTDENDMCWVGDSTRRPAQRVSLARPHPPCGSISAIPFVAAGEARGQSRVTS